MRQILTFLVVPLSLLGIVFPSFAQEIVKQSGDATTTERMNFAPGGTIRVEHSYGDLRVEGWNRPEVEITVTKSLLRFGQLQAQDSRRLDDIHMSAERKSPTELAISTTLASRHGDWAPPLPRTTTGGVKAEYEIHVPRDSKLVIHHGTGSVFVNGVVGDLDVSCGRGDILLWLPPGAYSIDAKTKFGVVSSELEGASLNRYLVGQRFTRSASPPAHQLHLRMGFGGITIQRMLPESEAPAAPADVD